MGQIVKQGATSAANDLAGTTLAMTAAKDVIGEKFKVGTDNQGSGVNVALEQGGAQKGLA